MVEKKNGTQTVLELWINVLKRKEYAHVFQREHRKNLIQLHVRFHRIDLPFYCT